MIEFIIEDEDKQIIKDIIDKSLINSNYLYTTESSSKAIFKIYIFEYNKNYDINYKKMRKIRDGNDWTSIFIITTNNKLLANTLYDKKLLILDVIEKEKNFENNLKRAIMIGIRNFENRSNVLKYTYKNIIYTIPFKDILYIEKNKEDKKCTINTKYNNFEIIGNLKSILDILDERFIKCSRSYIINIEQVLYYNTKENLITFYNGKSIYEISRSKKKEIQDYLRGIEFCRN